jgi:hypothetical protein
MAERDDFGVEEWALLCDAPLAACAAVALADSGGGGRETTALLMGWREAGRLFPASALVQALVVDADPQERALRERSTAEVQPQRTTYEDIRAEALGMCRRAHQLLAQRGTPQDVADYRGFVLHLAGKVARATGEGGLLGAGGERVSPVERATLRELAIVLGEKPG